VMVGGSRLHGGLLATVLLTAFLGIAGCRSAHIDVTVENRTGAEAQLLEVDYPSASFGVGSLVADQDYHYRIQVRGSGALKVQYTEAGGHKEQITGPALTEHQQGRLTVTLLPGGGAEFHPELTNGH
jgi:hypothetical protein